MLLLPMRVYCSFTQNSAAAAASQQQQNCKKLGRLASCTISAFVFKLHAQWTDDTACSGERVIIAKGGKIGEKDK